MYYRSIASLSEYVLVNQYRPAIERYTRVESHQWLMESYEGLDAIVRLKLADLELSAADIYEDVSFPSAPPASSASPAHPTGKWDG